MKLVVTLFLAAVSAIMTDNLSTTKELLSINNPVANQMLVPNEQVTLKYTVIGVVKNSSNPNTVPAPNYPSSLDVYFRWTSKNNTDRQPVSLTAASGLSTIPMAGGARDKVYTHRWKLPNCRFFKRYTPSDWSFTLVFEPQYPEITTPKEASSNSAKSAHVQPLGPKQDAITVPISINLNSTGGNGHHHKHKGC